MTPDISQGLKAAEQALRNGRRLVVRGPVGSGLRTLATELAHKHEDMVLIELLDLEEPDAPAAGLLQGIAALPDTGLRRQFLETLPRTEQAAQAVARALAEAGKTLCVLIPPAWARVGEEADDDKRRSRGRALLRGLATAPHLLVLLSDLQVDLADLGLPPLEEARLSVPSFPLNPDAFGEPSYASAARQLHKVLPDHQTSPLVWRLAVGALALRAPLLEVRALCLQPASGALPRLVPLLTNRIRSTPSLANPVRRALRVRRTLPRQVLVAMTRVPVEHTALLTDCLGYGDPVRISPALRTRLLEELGGREASSGNEAHAELASHYRSLDGIASPALVKNATQMEAWVERAHHLAWSGERGAQDWQALELPSPEFYWDRARALSIRYKRYDEAARVYLICAEHFPEDDYSQHYAAWNLEKTGQQPELCLQHYLRATELAPDNPWWNARLVSFLIRSGKRQEARQAWRRALQQVDPDGTATLRSPWMTSHLHYWVAKDWLESGHWREAQRVLEEVPPHIQERSTRDFAELMSRIKAARSQECKRFEEWIAAQSGPTWEKIQETWEELSRRFPDIPPPAAGPGEDERARLTWSLQDLYVELEAAEDGTLTWYARDHRSQVSDSGAVTGTQLSPELVGWLEGVIHA